MKMREWNKRRWIFFDKHNLGYPFIHIHPYKQKAVKYLVDNIYDSIDNVIIFGSSVRNNHIDTSDLDVCIIGDLTNKSLLRIPEINYNWLDYESLSDIIEYRNKIDSVRYDIFNEGVMVYEKY